MKFTKLFLALGALAAWSFSAQAAISVTALGTPAIPFTGAAAPPVGDWATLSVGANNAGTYTTAAALGANVVTMTAAGINTVLATSTTVTPAPSANAVARLNTAGQYLQTRVTGNQYTLLKATLQNDSGSVITDFTVSYDLGVLVNPTGGYVITEEVPGHLAYYSLSGAANSWVAIPSFTTGTAGPLSAAISGISWAAGAPLYMIWADDNGSGTSTDGGATLTVEGAYTIDNFAVSSVVTSGAVSANLTAPTDNQVIFSSQTPVATASSDGTATPVSLQFFVDGNSFGASSSSSTYSLPLTGLTPGTYMIYAVATDANLATAVTPTRTFVIHDEFASLGTPGYCENFDSMGATGPTTPTPLGWYVGNANPFNTISVTVGDGSIAPNANHGWNYGIVGADPTGLDRSLGTAPTGSERDMLLRIKNTTGSNILAFELRFDAEQWRFNTSNGVVEVLTNYVSYDLGATWIPTTFDFTSPVVGLLGGGQLDGNDSPNRVANIGGIITTPAPVGQNGIIYVRWYNFNDVGTDGAMAIDNVCLTVTSSEEAVLFVAVPSPANGQVIAAAGCTTSANITVNALAGAASGNTITSVDFQLDGGAAVNDTTAPYSATFTGAALGAHTITVTANQSGGATVVSNLTVTVVGNPTPVVTMGDVYSGGVTGLTFGVGSLINSAYTVTDNNLVSVEFFLNGTRLRSNNAVFIMEVGDALAGLSTYMVRATDACGAIGEASVNVTVTNPPVYLLVTNGSLWKYYATNAAPPVDNEGDQWFSTAYDDTVAVDPLWLSGFAEIGGGDGPGRPERTIADIGPAGNRYRTMYFRHVFNVPSLAGRDELIISSMHDDGAVVFLNGAQVAVFNITNPPITYTNLAQAGLVGDGAIYYSTNVASSLVVGENTLAVEVHQTAIDSTDLSFDLMLFAVPKVFIALDSVTDTVTLSWTATGHTLQRSDSIDPTSWVDVTSTSPHVVMPASSALSPRFYRLRP